MAIVTEFMQFSWTKLKDNNWPGMSSFASPQYERTTTEELVWAQHLHVIMVKKGILVSKNCKIE